MLKYTNANLRQTVPLGKMLGWKKPDGNWPAQTWGEGRNEVWDFGL